MSKANPQRKRAGRAWRYRAYFVVADITTVLALIGLARVVADPGKLIRDDEPASWNVALALLGLFLPLLLVFARSWRDEFAELCWRQSAATTLKGLFLVPVFALFGLGFWAGWNDAHQRAAGLEPVKAASPLEAYNAGDALEWFWFLMITLFVLAFQFHRWRGSR